MISSATFHREFIMFMVDEKQNNVQGYVSDISVVLYIIKILL